MLKLSSDYLPDQIDPPQKAGVGIVLQWYQPYKPAPGIKIDMLAKYSTGSGALGVNVAITNPNLVGRYFEIAVGMELSSISALAWSGGVFNPVDDPLDAVIGDCWAGTTAIGVMTSSGEIAGQALAAAITGKFVLPYYDSNYNYTIALPSGFTVTGVVAESLQFTQAGLSPTTGQFKQVGTTLTLYGSATSYRPEPFSTLYVSGVLAVAAPSSPKLAIAVFDLQSTGISIVDAMDYAGLVFAPSQDVYSPASGDFFWNRPTLTIFADMQYAGSLVPVTRSGDYKVQIGQLAYFGVP